MKKRIITISVVLALVLTALTGCGKESVNINEQSPVSSPSVSQEQSPAPSPVVEAGAVIESKDDTNTSESSKPTKEPTSSKPQESTSPTNTPSAAPVTTPEVTPAPTASISVADLMAKMIGALPAETYSLSEMPYDMYEGIYGINPANFEEVLVYGSMMNVKANEIIIIKAKNNAGVSEAKSLLSNRLAALDEQWKRYLPDQYELVQAGTINTNGLYVALVIAEGANSAVSTFNSLTK